MREAMIIYCNIQEVLITIFLIKETNLQRFWYDNLSDFWLQYGSIKKGRAIEREKQKQVKMDKYLSLVTRC